MKTRQSFHLSLFVLSLILSTPFVGCRTNIYDRGDAAARSLQNAATEVQVEGHYLTYTISALEDLINKPAPDLRPQFNQFRRNLDRLEESARRNEKAAQAALEKNALYLASWDLQITNMNYEVVRSRSETRRAEVAERFKAVNRRYMEVRTTIQPLLTYLVDIRRALNSDLTLAGLESVKPVVANAADNAKKVQLALTRLTDELADSGARMSSTGYQNPSSPTNVAAH